MKLKRLFISLLILLTSCTSCSNGNDSKTKYYVPKVNEKKYYDASFEFIESKYKKNREERKKYDFAKVIVTSKQTLIDGDNIYKLSKRTSLKNEYNEMFDRYIQTGYGKDYDTSGPYSLSTLADICIKMSGSLYIIGEHTNYYSSPFAHERECYFSNEIYTVKTILSNDFLVESIVAKSLNNQIKVKFYYYNEEDIPTKSCETDKETYFDMAFIKLFNSPTYSGVNVVFKGDILFDKVTHIERFEDVSATVNYNFLFGSADDFIPKFGKYRWVANSIDVNVSKDNELLGNLVLENISKIRSRIYNYYHTYAMPFTLEGKNKYYCNPMAFSNALSTEEIYFEFNEYMALTKFKQVDKANNLQVEVEFVYY